MKTWVKNRKACPFCDKKFSTERGKSFHVLMVHFGANHGQASAQSRRETKTTKQQQTPAE